jgi:hypothetical protein
VRSDTKTELEKHNLNIQLAEEYSKKRDWPKAKYYIDKAFLLSQFLDDHELIATTYELSGRIAYFKEQS